MAFKPKKIYDNLKDVPEDIKGLYEEAEVGGKAVYKLKPDVQKAFDGKDLKEVVSSQKKENEELKKRLDEISKNLSKEIVSEEQETMFPLKKEETKQVIAKQETQVDTGIQKQLQAHKMELDELKRKNEELVNTNLEEKKSNMVTRHIEQTNGVTELLLSKLMNDIGIDPSKADSDSLFVKDSQGDPVYEGSQKKSINDYILELKEHESFKHAFLKDKKIGVGTNNFENISNQKIDRKSNFALLNDNEKVKYIEQHGSEAYASAVNEITREKVNEITKAYSENSSDSGNLI